MRPSLLQMQMMMVAGSLPAGAYVDDYVTPVVAYGIRKLVRGYTGPAIRVRRSSDGAEADINFSGKSLDTAALSAHVGTDDGYVTVVYDQTVGSNDFVQGNPTSQAKIVSAGTYLGAIVGDGINSKMNTASAVGSGANQVVTLFGRCAIQDTASSTIAYFLDAGYFKSGENGYGIYYDPRAISTNGYSVATSKSVSNNVDAFAISGGINTVSTVTLLINSGYIAGIQLFVNGSSITETGSIHNEASQFTFNAETWTLGNYAGGTFASYWTLESLVMVEADALSARTDVEAAL